MNHPPYPNDPNDPHSQPTTAGQYPQFPPYPGQFPQNTQPEQFAPSPQPPGQPAATPPSIIKPCSNVVLSILFLLDIVCWICAFVPGRTGNFGKSGVTGLVVTMLIIDWKGVLTFNGKINWKNFGGGKRFLLFCLYFAVLPLALIGNFLQYINTSSEAKKQKLPLMPARTGRPMLAIVIGFFIFIFVLAANDSAGAGTTTAYAPTQQVAHVAPTQMPTPTPTTISAPTPRPIHYPPTTVADLRGLAAKGDAYAIHTVYSKTVGMVAVCPEARREVTVDPSVTGQQLAEDLLAYFYAQQLDYSCGSLVLAYHNQAEIDDPVTGGPYTAGLINLNVYDSSGALNFDPNASNLKHQLTLNVGSFDLNQEYVVTY